MFIAQLISKEREPIIPAFGRMRQEDFKFEAGLYSETLSPTKEQTKG
jgi:hypothetical protein